MGRALVFFVVICTAGVICVSYLMFQTTTIDSGPTEIQIEDTTVPKRNDVVEPIREGEEIEKEKVLCWNDKFTVHYREIKRSETDWKMEIKLYVDNTVKKNMDAKLECMMINGYTVKPNKENRLIASSRELKKNGITRDKIKNVKIRIHYIEKDSSGKVISEDTTEMGFSPN